MKNYVNSLKRGKFFKPLTKVALSAMLASSSFTGYGQLKNYIQDIHAKNYSIEKVPGLGGDYVNAGTLFNKFVGPGIYDPRADLGVGIQFMHTDGNGNLLVDPGTGFSVAKKYTFPDYVDVRCVDIVAYTSSESIIVAQARSTQVPNNRDMILVLTVDNSSGTLLSTRELAYTTPTLGDYGNIYATHAIYHEDQSNNNSYLYICGYDGIETQLNSYPEFIPQVGPSCYDKRILVMKYDIDNNAGNPNSEVVAVRTWDYPWASCQTSPDYPEIYDFDMAMRLVPINDGSGDIYVTGSTNSDVVWYTNGTPSAAYPSYGSATLSLRIDETDNGMGDGLNTVAIRPFIERNAVAATFPYKEVFEHGYGAFEDNTGNGLYVFSNEYTPENAAGYGFKTSAQTINVTYIDKATLDFNANTIIVAGAPVIQDYHRVSFHAIDYNWGTQVLNSPNGTDKVYLAGLQSNWDQQGCGGLPINGNNAPSLTNINPFISEIEPTWTVGATNTIGINNINFWKTYFTLDGTGFFEDLGGGLSNITWPTEFVAKTPNLFNLSFMAPRWDKARSVLGVKYITTDQNGDMPATTSPCINSFQNCTVNYGLSNIYDAWYFDTHTEFIPEVASESRQANDEFYIPTPVDCDGFAMYKPTTIENVNESGLDKANFDVYPNPAQNYVNVKVKGNVKDDAPVTVALYNMMGQQVAELFNGKASQLKGEHRMNIPSIASGIYMLNITSGDKQLHTQRLTIQ